MSTRSGDSERKKARQLPAVLRSVGEICGVAASFEIRWGRARILDVIRCTREMTTQEFHIAGESVPGSPSPKGEKIHLPQAHLAKQKPVRLRVIGNAMNGSPIDIAVAEASGAICGSRYVE